MFIAKLFLVAAALSSSVLASPTTPRNSTKQWEFSEVGRLLPHPGPITPETRLIIILRFLPPRTSFGTLAKGIFSVQCLM